MLWLLPTALIACIATFFLGFHFRDLTKKVEHLEGVIQSKVSRRVEPEEPRSEVIDPMDEVQTAMWEHKKMMEKLNANER